MSERLTRRQIHNATFNNLLTASGPSTLAMARDLANYHEYYSFTAPTLGGIGNSNVFISYSSRQVAHNLINRQLEVRPSYRVCSLLSAPSRMLPRRQKSRTSRSHTSVSPLILVSHSELTQRTAFISLFNMTNVAAAQNPAFPNPQGIVDYASIAILELRANMAGTGHDVRFLFRNGTDTGPPIAYNLFGGSSVDTDLNTMITTLTPSLLSNTTSWCHACNQTLLRGCSGALALESSLAASPSTGSSGSSVSPVGAGFIGAGVTLALAIALLASLIALGLVTIGKKRRMWNDRLALGQTKVHITGGAESFTSSTR